MNDTRNGDKTMATGESNVPSLILSEADLRKIYFTIRARQDDCRKVTEEFSGYETMRQIDLELEALNSRVAKQIQAIRGQ